MMDLDIIEKGIENGFQDTGRSAGRLMDGKGSGFPVIGDTGVISQDEGRGPSYEEYA